MVKSVPLCSPAQVYLIFVIVSVLLFILNAFFVKKRLPKTQFHLMFMLVVIGVLLQLIYGMFIVGVLDYLCKSGREEWSWFIIVSMVVISLMIAMFGIKMDDVLNKM